MLGGLDAVDFQTLSFDMATSCPTRCICRTYAATAWYHKALKPALFEETAEGGAGRGEGLLPMATTRWL